MPWYVGYDPNNGNDLVMMGQSPSTPVAPGVTVIPVTYSGIAISANGKPNFRLVSWNPTILQFDDNNPVLTSPIVDSMGYQTWDGDHDNFYF